MKPPKYPSAKALRCARAVVAETNSCIAPRLNKGARLFRKLFIRSIAELIHDHMEPTKGQRGSKIVNGSIHAVYAPTI